jgi:hypothetical protein
MPPLCALARLTGTSTRNHCRLPEDAGRKAIVCARGLLADLHDIAGRLPGASGFNFHPFGALHITVSTDVAVSELGDALGLGARERRGDEGQWWYRAASPHVLGITIVGPLHTEPPASEEPVAREAAMNASRKGSAP